VSSFNHLSKLFHHQDPRIVGGLSAGIVLLTAATIYLIRSHRPTPEEIERRRRERLAALGRITDGILLDARNADGTLYEDPHGAAAVPHTLLYSYRLAGVTYDCAQDVSAIPDRIRGFRLDQPIQLRYDPRNPGNSILVSESWSGLRLTAIHSD
jgi:hypothetical protein